MTTVDVYIRRMDGPGSFSLHNGMWGPATTALHALIDAFQAGAVSGPWHSTYIDTTVKGTIVRSILAGIDERDAVFRRDEDWARFAAFREAIEDDADYAVKATGMRLSACCPATIRTSLSPCAPTIPGSRTPPSSSS